jgi:hypothetical protein
VFFDRLDLCRRPELGRIPFKIIEFSRFISLFRLLSGAYEYFSGETFSFSFFGLSVFTCKGICLLSIDFVGRFSLALPGLEILEPSFDKVVELSLTAYKLVSLLSELYSLSCFKLMLDLLQTPALVDVLVALLSIAEEGLFLAVVLFFSEMLKLLFFTLSFWATDDFVSSTLSLFTLTLINGFLSERMVPRLEFLTELRREECDITDLVADVGLEQLYCIVLSTFFLTKFRTVSADNGRCLRLGVFLILNSVFTICLASSVKLLLRCLCSLSPEISSETKDSSLN